MGYGKASRPRNLHKLVVGVCAWGMLASGFAKPSFLIRSWQTDDGLPHNSPTATYQAPDGYVWIATNSGLARFDGMRFENFGSAEGLPANQVPSLFIDSKARVWAGTQQGVAVRESGQWRTPPGVEVPGPVWSICETRDGSIWFATEQGAWQWKDEELRQWREGLPEPHVRHLEAAPDGSLWIICPNSATRWDNGKLLSVPSLAPWMGRELWGITPTAEGDWIIYGQGLLLRGGSDGWQDLTEGMPGKEGIHLASLTMADGTLWVATRNQGIACRKNGSWTKIDASSGLSNDDARALMKDREGNLWVCTNGGGVNVVRQRRIEVIGLAEGLGRHVTTALATDREGNLWAGTDGGGVKKWVGGRFDPAFPEDMLPDPYIWSLCADSGSGLWIGTFRHGVIHWGGGMQREIFSTKEGLLAKWIPVIMKNRAGQVWLGTHNGGVQKIVNGQLQTLLGSADGTGAPVTNLLEDQGGALWVGTSGNGLWRNKEGKWKQFGQPEGLPGGVVSALHEDASGNLWVGISDGGLCVWRGDRFVVLNTRHGLIDHSVLQILDDSRGNLWFGTDVGLQRVDISDLLEVADGRRPTIARAEIFGRGDGLVSPQFSSGHGNLATETSDGSLWFSLVSGAVRVPPDFKEVPTEPLTLTIETVGKAGQVLWHHEQPSVAGDEVKLEWPVAPLELRFAAPSFSSPEKLRFRHRLVGLDDTWRDAEGLRSATFSSLPPGDFRFEVNAARPGGPWSENPAILRIQIRPRFWQTRWFQAMIVCSGVLLVALLAHWASVHRVRRRMKVLEQERKIDGERARIAQDLHDDLGATLSEINFLGVLGAKGSNSAATRERLEGIVERAQRMAKSLDEIVWTVNPENDTLSSTVNYICSRTQESLHAADIRCRLEVANDLPSLMMDSDGRHHLLMAVNEAVNNVMKHAAAKEVRLTIGCIAGSLELVISDDGKGFNPATAPTSRNGLRNLRARLADMGGECTVVSTPGRGTRVTLAVPLEANILRAALRPRRAGNRAHRIQQF